MNHDVYVGALPLDQELVVDSGKDGTKNLDLKNEAEETNENLSENEKKSEADLIT